MEYLEKKWPYHIAQDFLSNLFSTLDWIRLNPHSFMEYKNSDSIRKYVLSEFHTLYFEIFESIMISAPPQHTHTHTQV